MPEQRIDDILQNASQSAGNGDENVKSKQSQEPPKGDQGDKVNQGNANPNPNTEIDEQKILEALSKNEELQYKFLSERLGREVKSLDDLQQEKIVEKTVEVDNTPELPDVVKKFWDWSKETGRTNVNDFVKATKDWTAEDKDSVVMEYIRRTKGLEGDTLKGYMKDRFKPDDEDITERQRRMAEYDFNGTYNEAIDFLKKDQEKYSYRDESVDFRQQVEDQKRKEQEQFSQGIQSAANDFDKISITEDFSYELGGDDKVSEDFKSMDDVVKQFSTEQGFDYKSLLQTLFVGRNMGKILKAYRDHVVNSLTEEDIKRMSNSNINPDRGKNGEGPNASDVMNALNSY